MSDYVLLRLTVCADPDDPIALHVHVEQGARPPGHENVDGATVVGSLGAMLDDGFAGHLDETWRMADDAARAARATLN
jgi:hypothetical protein